MREGRDPIRDMIVESGLDAEEYAGVAEVLATLRSAVPEEPPTPSAELASLLTGVTALRPRWNSVAIASGLAAAVILSGGVAAANNSLPEPLQRFAHSVSEKVLPFEFPSPEDRHAQGREGPVQLPAPARNDTDQGKHVGKGAGGGRTANPGEEKNQVPDDPSKPDDRPTPPTPTPAPPTPPERPDRPAQGGGEDPGADDQGGDAQTDETDPAQGSKPTDPGSGDEKGKSGDRSARRG